MRRSIALAAVLTCLSTVAFASAIDDGNAGLNALNNGDYAKAIRLFTHALKSGQLQGDDKEFAYFNRGKAYLGKGETGEAVNDLKMAVKLKPDDSDAQSALSEAQTMQANATPGRRRHGDSPSFGAGDWGVLSSVAGKYFWQSEGGDPHKTMQHCEWAQPQEILLCTQRNKHEKMAVNEFKLDPASGKILDALAVTSGVYYGTAIATRDSVTEFFFISNVPVKGITVYAADGSATDTTQRYSNGAWTDIDTHQDVPATDQEVQDSGYFKKKD